MNKRKSIQIGIVILVFVILDIWFGNTYHYMDIGSMLYLSTFILVIAGILFIDRENYKKFFNTFGIIVGVFAVVFLVGSVTSSRMINAKRYANVLGQVRPVEFKDLYGEDHNIEVSYVDKDSALLSAEKKMGELSEVSSRFDINTNEFTQINYQGKMARVAPFVYADTFKKYTNFSSGVPYYVLVTTGDGNMNAKSEIVTLPSPIKYYPGAPLQYDLRRHVALHHKFSYLDDWNFEIDDTGHPYWIVQSITKRVGIWGAKDMDSVIVVDAVSGETARYELNEIPEWVDSVYPTDMMLSHAKDHFTLKGGYFNSFMQQQGVMAVDQQEGSYNYVSIDDEIYIFTGIRPIKLDSSSTTGLLFMNKRTGETLQMDLPGVSITAAEMTSVGSIQEKGYTPTTPILQNVGGFPTYVMSLKDTSSVVRGFSMVNYQDYTKSAVGDTYQLSEKNYLNVMGNQVGIVPEEIVEKTGVVSDVKQVIIDGNTHYFIRLEGEEAIYQANLILSDELAFLTKGDKVMITTNGSKIVSFEIVKEKVNN
ncbi:hypothetical protein PT129_01670 [Erysipelothrix rhusiopathiae]|nr:hypothetical protein [Erysipelothrix rhusiopathiae]MDE8166454.1 hypothetical protein [Erysipelothrix rhusiopathiae]MDE8226968.1 hypothetical protein [Erysipelothrix rhusiopathiae]